MSIEELLKNYRDPDIIDLPKEVQLQMYNNIKNSILKGNGYKGVLLVTGTEGEINNDNFNWNLDEMGKKH